LHEGIDSIELNVTGPGMEQIKESIEIVENSITIEVPSGENTEIMILMDLSEIHMLIPDV